MEFGEKQLDINILWVSYISSSFSQRERYPKVRWFQFLLQTTCFLFSVFWLTLPSIMKRYHFVCLVCVVRIVGWLKRA